ncbi:universal stress protein [Blastococcus sp. TF02A-30]|uniref:universal stress protein n=1 Tax=Blastococcus sp. TF02A-30 TaxID=2250580 RepID=UPI000DEA9006|nr:universal stress protein [Blastococcus sp. TF02A-30]RBY92873.1 hypothetical protein DQ241_02185 [Blastococcus sp. TF02A-30]
MSTTRSSEETQRTGDDPSDDAGTGIAPLRLLPLVPRRPRPWIVVEVEPHAAGHRPLVWALREAARREATVLAVGVLDVDDDGPLPGLGRISPEERAAAEDLLEAQLLRARTETGVAVTTRTAVLERPLLDALTAATRGADLVVVGPNGKHLLRPAVPRPPARRTARGA